MSWEEFQDIFLKDSQAGQWNNFMLHFGLDGTDGLLDYPCYEGAGNHDGYADDSVRDGIRDRHGSLAYSWDWGVLHVVSLDEYPAAEFLDWLALDLAAATAGGISR